MNQLSMTDLRTHVTVLGWLYIIGHIIFLIIGAFVFVLLTSIGAISGDSEAMVVLGIVAALVAGLLTLLAIPGIAAGIGLLQRRSWGRILAIVVGILNLVNVPIGTVVGAYTLWVLLQENATPYFEDHGGLAEPEGEQLPSAT
jgi:hypothetical protein